MDDELAKNFLKHNRKAKKKVVAGNLLDLQKAEDNKLEKKIKKRTDEPTETQIQFLRRTKADDEWEDVVDEKQVDTQNIRVFNLGHDQTEDDDQNGLTVGVTNARSESPVDSNCVKNINSDRCEASKWSDVLGNNGNDDDSNDRDSTTTTTSAATTAAPSDQYVPPTMMRATSKKPNLSNTEEFPTLAQASTMVDKKSKDRSTEDSNAGEGWSTSRSGNRPPAAGVADNVYRPPIGGGGEQDSGSNVYRPGSFNSNRFSTLTSRQSSDSANPPAPMNWRNRAPANNDAPSAAAPSFSAYSSSSTATNSSSFSTPSSGSGFNWKSRVNQSAEGASGAVQSGGESQASADQLVFRRPTDKALDSSLQLSNRFQQLSTDK